MLPPTPKKEATPSSYSEPTRLFLLTLPYIAASKTAAPSSFTPRVKPACLLILLTLFIHLTFNQEYSMLGGHDMQLPLLKAHHPCLLLQV